MIDPSKSRADVLQIADERIDPTVVLFTRMLFSEALLREVCQRYGVDFREMMAASPAREQESNGL